MGLGLNPGCCCDPEEIPGFLAVCMCGGTFQGVFYSSGNEAENTKLVDNVHRIPAYFPQVAIRNEEPQIICSPHIWGFLGTGSSNWAYDSHMIEGINNRPFGLPYYSAGALWDGDVLEDRTAKIWTEFNYAPNSNQDGVFTASHWLISNKPDSGGGYDLPLMGGGGGSSGSIREDSKVDLYMLAKYSNHRSYMCYDDVNLRGSGAPGACRSYNSDDCNPTQYPLLDLNIYYDTSAKRVSIEGEWNYEEDVFRRNDLRFTVPYATGASFVSYEGPGDVDASQFPVVFVRNIKEGGKGVLVVQHTRTESPAGEGDIYVGFNYKMEVGYYPPTHRFIHVECEQCPPRTLLGSDSVIIPIGKNIATLTDDNAIFEANFNINGCEIGAMLMTPKQAGYYTAEDFVDSFYDRKGSPVGPRGSGRNYDKIHLKSWNSREDLENTFVKKWVCGCGSDEASDGASSTGVSGDWFVPSIGTCAATRCDPFEHVTDKSSKKIDHASVANLGWSGSASEVTRSVVDEDWTDAAGVMYPNIGSYPSGVYTHIAPALTNLQADFGSTINSWPSKFFQTHHHASMSHAHGDSWKKEYSAYLINGFKLSGAFSINLKNWTGDDAEDYGNGSYGQTKLSNWGGLTSNNGIMLKCQFVHGDGSVTDRAGNVIPENAIILEGWALPGLTFYGYGRNLYRSASYADKDSESGFLDLGNFLAGTDIEMTFEITANYPDEWKYPPKVGGLDPVRAIYPYMKITLKGNTLYDGLVPEAINKNSQYPSYESFEKWPPTNYSCMAAWFCHIAKGARSTDSHQSREIATFKNSSLNLEIL